jgi:hypothetical protein
MVGTTQQVEACYLNPFLHQNSYLPLPCHFLWSRYSSDILLAFTFPCHKRSAYKCFLLVVHKWTQRRAEMHYFLAVTGQDIMCISLSSEWPLKQMLHIKSNTVWAACTAQVEAGLTMRGQITSLVKSKHDTSSSLWDHKHYFGSGTIQITALTASPFHLKGLCYYYISNYQYTATVVEKIL